MGTRAPGEAERRRLLLVHAHPDDETIFTGATIAHYRSLDVSVTLVTCTLGEFGEVVVPELAGLVADEADQLGGYRLAEGQRATRALDVIDHRYLGGVGHWHDSGMMGTAANEHPRAFWRAAQDVDRFETAVDQLAVIIDEARPQVVVTYDPDGGYGHPDHVMAHRVTAAAVQASEWEVNKVYWCALPESVLQEGLDDVAASDTAFLRATVDEIGWTVPDTEVTCAIDASAHLAAKTAALRAHATQVLVEEPFFALSDRVGRRIDGVEYYRLAHGDASGPYDAQGRETDLFAGVA